MLRYFILINLFSKFFLLSAKTPYIPLQIRPYDEYGCCVSCGYQYCETLLECIRPWETECPEFINPFVSHKNNYILE